MSEKLTSQQLAIETATEADVSGIGRAHFQSMLETYPNPGAGVDEAWIHQNLAYTMSPQGDGFRRQTVHQAETDPGHTLYLVVRNIQGQVVGFFHSTRSEHRAKIEAIYLTREARGTGTADELMRRGLEFAGDRPISLEVLDYNQRAIRLYERYGFAIVPDSLRLEKEKLPLITMQRLATREAES